MAQLTKLVVESALEGELTAHLGYENHERAEEPGGNSWNGTRSKTVLTKAGPLQIDVPRDRAGTFEPVAVATSTAPRCPRRRSPRSPTKVLDGMAEWQNRPLDPV
ncbi:hypothetical protein SCMU_06000 [Sinomonas cyclohexanicum]|uniref:Mutator family transposase n=1 Tax=Sinomonas cyclohexanicum TaxID=322009 RepID=A0ABM7PRD6_SINCY|nr:hypothetical protein SCMU_06000 [Corynebacterium cyclohexanicum]